MQETTRGLRAAMMLPVAPGAGFGEMQEAFATMVAGMMRNNIRLAQEMLRIYGPQENAAAGAAIHAALDGHRHGEPGGDAAHGAAGQRAAAGHRRAAGAARDALSAGRDGLSRGAP